MFRVSDIYTFHIHIMYGKAKKGTKADCKQISTAICYFLNPKNSVSVLTSIIPLPPFPSYPVPEHSTKFCITKCL